MQTKYKGVYTRFLRDEERLILSDEKEMPLVLEASQHKDKAFLQTFLQENASSIIADMAHYGAVLLRGFQVKTDADFEDIIINTPGVQGISEAFMAENGRTHVGELKYVLHTNAVYKTGGTLYLGGFHTENYYSADVPGYLFFCCFEPSELGGETGLINTETLYRHLGRALQKKLEKTAFFVGKWLISEVAAQHKLSIEQVRDICQAFGLPVLGKGKDALVLMYKPSVFIHPKNQKKALQINLFELPTLNHELRKCFIQDYPGKAWFWHRLFWRLPRVVFNSIEYLSVLLIAFFHSPKKSYTIVANQLKKQLLKSEAEAPKFSTTRVGGCFEDKDVKNLAKVMRNYYCSFLWQAGDILLIDNKKVMHAGMPGFGPRLIRALIANPIAMPYTPEASGVLEAKDRETLSIGDSMAKITPHHANTKAR